MERLFAAIKRTERLPLLSVASRNEYANRMNVASRLGGDAGP
jgi:hypothetical protein